MSSEAITGFNAAADIEKGKTPEKSYADIGRERAERIGGRIQEIKGTISGFFGNIWGKAVEFGKKGRDMAVEAGYSALAVGEMASDAANYVDGKIDEKVNAVGAAVDNGVNFVGDTLTAGKEAIVGGIQEGYGKIAEKGRKSLEFVGNKANELKQNYEKRVEAARARREERLKNAETQRLIKEYNDAREAVNVARRRVYAAAQALNIPA